MCGCVGGHKGIGTVQSHADLSCGEFPFVFRTIVHHMCECAHSRHLCTEDFLLVTTAPGCYGDMVAGRVAGEGVSIVTEIGEGDNRGI